MPVEDILALASGDFHGIRVRDTLAAMVERYLTHATCEPSPPGSDAGCNYAVCAAHANEVYHGGPVSYVLALARDMRDHGWDWDNSEPVELKDKGTALADGHHRTLAASLAGLTEIPVVLDTVW